MCLPISATWSSKNLLTLLMLLETVSAEFLAVSMSTPSVSTDPSASTWTTGIFGLVACCLARSLTLVLYYQYVNTDTRDSSVQY